MSATVEQFATRQYVHLQGFLDRATCDRLTAEMKRLVGADRTFKDDQCPLSEAVYGAEPFDRLLVELLPRFEEASGKRLHPTYSYARHYRPGEELAIHTDREACEISATVTLGFDGDLWPFWIGDAAKTNASEIRMAAGDAVLYRGITKHHWRERYAGNWQVQVFLHYVDADGPYAQLKFDKRGGVTKTPEPTPAKTAAILKQLPPVVRVQNLLGSDAASRLLEYAMARKNDYAASDVVWKEKSIIDAAYRSSRKLPDLGPFATPFADAVMKILPSTLAELKLSNLQAPTLETEIVWQGDGAFFKRHIDTLEYKNLPSSNRVLTMVYYFHRQPKAFSGGQLRIYPLSPKPEPGVHVDVEPAHDSAVFFPSWFPHEVMPVECRSGEFADGRFSINCWFHKRMKQ